MEIINTILLFAAVITIFDPLTHMFAEKWYKNHPYAEKTAYFETLDIVYRHKYARPISIGIGVVCAVAGVLI
ncbi:MAG: hypothetical protein IJ007_06375 [Oscillospiraceae bacterium]|nr:hypothetical protein [Oscillospiraceae bacterium]